MSKLLLKSSAVFFPATIWGLDATFDPEIFRKVHEGDSLALLRAELVFSHLGFTRNHFLVPTSVFPDFKLSFFDSLHIFSGIVKMRWWLRDFVSQASVLLKSEADKISLTKKAVLPILEEQTGRKSAVLRLKNRKSRKRSS